MLRKFFCYFYSKVLNFKGQLQILKKKTALQNTLYESTDDILNFTGQQQILKKNSITEYIVQKHW